jgi:hypothetical protein
MAGEQGFEPQLLEPESSVLPLNYSPSPGWNSSTGSLFCQLYTQRLRRPQGLKKRRLHRPSLVSPGWQRRNRHQAR